MCNYQLVVKSLKDKNNTSDKEGHTEEGSVHVGVGPFMWTHLARNGSYSHIGVWE